MQEAIYIPRESLLPEWHCGTKSTPCPVMLIDSKLDKFIFLDDLIPVENPAPVPGPFYVRCFKKGEKHPALVTKCDDWKQVVTMVSLCPKEAYNSIWLVYEVKHKYQLEYPYTPDECENP